MTWGMLAICKRVYLTYCGNDLRKAMLRPFQGEKGKQHFNKMRIENLFPAIWRYFYEKTQNNSYNVTADNGAFHSCLHGKRAAKR